MAQQLSRSGEHQVRGKVPLLWVVEGDPGVVIAPSLIALHGEGPFGCCFSPLDHLPEQLSFAAIGGWGEVLCQDQQVMWRLGHFAVETPLGRPFR